MPEGANRRAVKTSRPARRAAVGTLRKGHGPEPPPRRSQPGLKVIDKNSLKSTGPSTHAGKQKSKFNALKHGMTAESTVLPDEDAAVFAARLKALNDDLQPRNEIEGMLIEGIALSRWMSLRVQRAAAADVSYQLRHLPIDQAREEEEKVIELGQLLLCYVPFPDPVRNVVSQGTYRAEPLDGPGQVNHPARLVLLLEGSVAGCDWLIAKFVEIKRRLDTPRLWRLEDGLDLLRLTGRQVIDVIRDYEAADLLSASLYLADAIKRAEAEANGGVSLDTLRAEFNKTMGRGTEFDQRREYLEQVERVYTRYVWDRGEKDPVRPSPASEQEARQLLAMVIDRQMARLQHIRASACASPTRCGGGARPAGVPDRQGGGADPAVRAVARPALAAHD